MLQTKTVVNDCYILQSPIGADPYSVHWLATTIFSAKRFVLRFIKADIGSGCWFTDFRQDYVRSYRVQGPAIADFVELEAWEEYFFISSEFNGETSLLQAMEAGKQWTMAQIINGTIALAEGLAAFHAQGIVYANLAAHSIIITDRGYLTPILKIWKPSLISLVPFIGQSTSDVSETFAYLAPEFKKTNTLRPESDIYALGMNLFRLFTGSLPFPNDQAIIRSSPPALRYAVVCLFKHQLPKELVRIIIKTLMPDPADRYPSIDRLIQALQNFAVLAFKGPDNASGLAPQALTGSSFESTAYFDSGPAQANGKLESLSARSPSSPAYPSSFQKPVPSDQTDLIILPEESLWTVDSYINFGLKAVYGDELAAEIYHQDPQPPIETTPAATLLSQDLVEIDQPTAPNEPAVDKPRQLTAKSNSVVQLVNDRSAALPSPRPEPSWRHQRIRAIDIKEIICRVAYQAEKSRGSFRFIEDPRLPYTANGLFDLLETLSNQYFYLNVGNISRYGTAGPADFLKSFQKALSRALNREKPAARGYLIRKLAQSDQLGFFKDFYPAKLESTRSELTIQASSEPWSLDSLSQLADSIIALSRKTKPLILVMRGVESVSRELHQLLDLLADQSVNKPVVVVAFFTKSYVEPWHALAVLNKTVQKGSAPKI